MSLFGSRAGMAALAGIGAAGAAKSAWRGLDPLAKSTITGAGIGAAYGAFSDNTSMLGGAAMGAAGGFAYPSTRTAFKMARASWAQRRSFGGALAVGGVTHATALAIDAADAGRFIGNTAKRAYNNFSALGRGFMGR